MSKRSFTPQAELHWHRLSILIRDRLLKNVYCSHCKGAVEIVDYTGSEQDRNLVLEGSCAQCGNRVVRLVETSDAPPPNN